MIFLLFACTGAAESGDSADTGSGPAWPCGPYSPQTVLFAGPGMVNYRSVFDYNNETVGVGVFTFEGLGTADLDGAEVWLHRGTGDTTDAVGMRHQWTVTTSYVCDVLGLQQARVEGTQILTTPDGSPTESTYERVYSVRPVVYPPGLAVGTVWQYHAVYTESHSDGTSVDREETVERSAEALEQVTVPAGTFDAVHVVMTNLETKSVGDLWTTEWTGTVLTNEMALVSHETFE